MADVQANIVLVTTGGDESATEVSKASKAVGGLTGASRGMESVFQHRFQHIGLQLFAQDAIRSAGLGREAREVVNLLNFTLLESASAAGLSSGGILLLVAGLAALGGIAYKVSQNQKDLTETLDKEIQTINTGLKPHQDIISAVERYEKATGHLTQQQKDLLAAERTLSDGMKADLLVAYQKQLVAVEQQIQANVAHAQTMHLVHSAAAQFKTVWDGVLEAFRAMFSAMQYVIPGWGNLTRGVQSAIQALDKYKSSVVLTESESRKLQKENDALRAKYQEIIDSINHLGVKTEDYYNKAAEEAEKSSKKQEEVVKKMASSIGSAYGNAIAKMIVEGKDFAESMQQAFTQMAEAIISDIIRIEIEWMILSSMGFPGGGGFGGFFATGGSRVVDRPTMFLAGEAGPEIATFTPVGSGGAPGGAGAPSIQIGTVHTVVQGVNDPDRIADQVGDKIIQRIRGMGELNFTRG